MLPLVKIQLNGSPWSPAGALKSNLNNNSTWKLPSGESADSFTIKLASQPTNQVIFDVAVSDDTEASVNSSTLTFNASNWNQAQTVTVSGVDDPIRDGSVNSQVVVGINKSGTQDAKYVGLLSQSVSVSTTDDEQVPIVSISANSTSPSENVGTVKITATQSVAAAEETTVTLATSGTATKGSGQDYTINSSTIKIPAGQTSGTANPDNYQ